MKKLQKNKSVVQKKLSKCRQFVSKQIEEKDKVLNEMSRMRGTINELKKDLSELRISKGEESVKMSKMEKKRHEKEIKKLTDEISVLKKEIEVRRIQEDDMDKFFLEMKGENSRLRKMEKTFEKKLRIREKKLGKMNEDNERLKMQVKKLKGVIERNKAEDRVGSEIEIKKLKAQLKKVKQEFNEEQQKKNESWSSFKDKLEMEVDLMTTEITSKRILNERLTTQINTLRDEMKRLELQKDREHAQHTSKLVSQIENLEDEKEKLLDVNQDLSLTIEEIKSDRSMFQKKLKEEKEGMEELKQKCKELKNERMEWKKKVNIMEDQLGYFRIENESISKKLKDTEVAQEKKSIKLIAKLKAKVETTTVELTDTKKDFVRIEKEKKKMEKAMRQMVKEQGSFGEISRKLERNKRKIESLISEKREFKKTIYEMMKENKELREGEGRKGLRRELTMLKMKNEKLESQLKGAELAREITRDRKGRKRLKKKGRRYLSMNEELDTDDVVSQKMASLNGTLRKHSNSFRELKKKLRKGK